MTDRSSLRTGKGRAAVLGTLGVAALGVGLILQSGLASAGSSAPRQPDPWSPGPPGEKLGGIRLPYSGPGSVVFDVNEQAWLFVFPAPAEFDCTHLGWTFPAAGVRLMAAEADRGWATAGMMDVFLDAGKLRVMVESDDGTCWLAFAFHGRLDDPAWELMETQDGLLLISGPPGMFGPSAEEDCPGGSCECGKGPPGACPGCRACCPEGYYPRCTNCGVNSCSCICLRQQQGGPLELVEYGVVGP